MLKAGIDHGAGRSKVACGMVVVVVLGGGSGGCYLIFICSRYKRAHATSSY